MDVKFKFKLAQRVKIKRTGVAGTVIGAYVNRHGEQEFRVEYDGPAAASHEDWFHSDLIVAI